MNSSLRIAIAISSLFLVPWVLMPLAAQEPGGTESAGLYRLPYADGTRVQVFDDFTTHRPRGRVDLFAMGGRDTYGVVAAAAGRIVAIQDSFSEQQSGRAAADCHNNYVWCPSKRRVDQLFASCLPVSDEGSKTEVGDRVAAGTYLGEEGAVGCAMLKHVHFEVAVPDGVTPIDAGGFLTDNEGGKRERNPRFCDIPSGTAVKDAVYLATPC